MHGKSRLRYILLIFPAAIVALDVVFFYLDDFLDEGRSIFFVDTYGQGFFTWWLDFERFWGNIELWSLGIGVWMGFFAAFAFGAAPGALGTKKMSLVKWPLVFLVAVLLTSMIFGLMGWGSPVPYSIGGILVNGWYPGYFPSNVLFMLVAFSGAWLIPPAISKLRRGRVSMSLSPVMAASLLIPALVMVHFALASEWTVTDVNNLQTPITSLIGLLLVTTPLFAFMVASVENVAGQEHVEAVQYPGGETLVATRKVHAWVIMIIILAILGCIILLLATGDGLNTSIDINSSFIPRNFLTWVTAAIVATITFFTIHGGHKQ